ncbi:hypothetical protein ACTFIW_000482 [Dictyostelium discoideum]
MKKRDSCNEEKKEEKKEDGFTCQTMFQVKYRKDCSQTNSINYFSQIANRFVLNQWNGKEISLFPSYDYVLTIDASESGAGATLKKGNKIIKTWSFQWSIIQSNMLERSSDSVKWSFDSLIISPDSIKGPVINAKEQRKCVLSILELTSLDDTNSQVCPVRHLVTYLRASKGRRKPHSGNLPSKREPFCSRDSLLNLCEMAWNAGGLDHWADTVKPGRILF